MESILVSLFSIGFTLPFTNSIFRVQLNYIGNVTIHSSDSENYKLNIDIVVFYQFYIVFSDPILRVQLNRSGSITIHFSDP